jgi:hypothetical protein
LGDRCSLPLTGYAIEEMYRNYREYLEILLLCGIPAKKERSITRGKSENNKKGESVGGAFCREHRDFFPSPVIGAGSRFRTNVFGRSTRVFIIIQQQGSQ